MSVLAPHWNDAGSTPMIEYGWLFSVSVRPITFGSDPSALRQKPSLTITTRVSPPGRSSSAVKLRPITGVTRSVGRKVAVTFRPSTTSASPVDVNVKPPFVIAARD